MTDRPTQCPRDGTPLVRGECPLCQWTPRRRGRGEADGQCRHSHDGERCPFPAVWSDGNQGGACLAQWCWWHQLDENRGHGLEQDQWYARYRDRTAVLDRLAIRYHDGSPAARCAELGAEYPEWRRRDDETRSQYGQRMSTLGRKLARRLNRRVRQEDAA